ncbi:MAG: TIR domain-containing protein [Anaerolineae bacterium]|nr:TIR domain-containing protein [Anaerolineae bacterium]
MLPFEHLWVALVGRVENKAMNGRYILQMLSDRAHFRLHGTRPIEYGLAFPLPGFAGRFTIGRDPNCFIQIVTDSQIGVSQLHCVLRYNSQEQAFFIQDVSRNGSRFNNVVHYNTLAEYRLESGHVLELGNGNGLGISMLLWKNLADRNNLQKTVTDPTEHDPEQDPSSTQLANHKRKIFVSYARTDTGIANALLHILRDGLPTTLVFVDREIPGGDSFSQTLADEIDTCDFFLIIMTPQSRNSKWVRREVERALNRSKIILPYLASGTGEQAALPWVDDLQWITTPTQLIDTIRKHLNNTN